MTRFTELVDRYKYPPKLKGQLSSYFSKIFAYVCDHFDGTKSFKVKVVRTWNSVAYLMILGEDFWDTWDDSNVLSCLPDIDDRKMKSVLKDAYLQLSDIRWDIDIADDTDLASKVTPTNDSGKVSVSDPKLDEYLQDSKLQQMGVDIVEDDLSDYTDEDIHTNLEILSSDKSYQDPTPPDDLFLQGPKIPKLDSRKIYAQGIIDGRKYVVYRSIPEIPTRQCEISVTTEVDKMTPQELLALYPNRRLYTRLQPLYEQLDRVGYDNLLGCILHISGFSRKQMVDNIIKYPHLENLLREGKSKGNIKYVDFWKYIEIDGQLHKTVDVWDQLDDTKRLPKIRAVMEDYVVRRYLLERDIKHIEHKYKMFGSFDPYLTLFMPAENYRQLGYTDTVSLAKKCVQSRVSFKQTRNPVLRRLNTNV